jgi:3',5'-cyclic AMP phosphodiesterase CpdA
MLSTVQRRPDWDKLHRDAKSGKAEAKSDERARREKQQRDETLRKKADTPVRDALYRADGTLGFGGKHMSFRMVGLKKPTPLAPGLHDWQPLPYAEHWQNLRICKQCGAKSSSIAARIACPGRKE